MWGGSPQSWNQGGSCSCVLWRLKQGRIYLSGPSDCRQNSLACDCSILMVCFFKASYGREFLLHDESCFREDLGFCERLVYNQTLAVWSALISSVSWLKTLVPSVKSHTLYLRSKSHALPTLSGWKLHKGIGKYWGIGIKGHPSVYVHIYVIGWIPSHCHSSWSPHLRIPWINIKRTAYLYR